MSWNWIPSLVPLDEQEFILLWIADHSTPIKLFFGTTIIFIVVRIVLHVRELRVAQAAEDATAAAATVQAAGTPLKALSRMSRAVSAKLGDGVRSAVFRSHSRAKHLKEVFADELVLVNERRAEMLGPAAEIEFEVRVQEEEPRPRQSDEYEPIASLQQGSVYVEPTVAHGLVGLCLSGGGIRSATFCLGVLQSLAKYDLLRHVDYMSTVSGGGFIGGAVSALLLNPRYSTARDAFPLRHIIGEREGIALRHLRKSANYLGSSLVDSVIVPVLIVRGFFLNMIALFPVVWLLVLARDNLGSPAACTTVQPFRIDQCFGLTKTVAANILVHMLAFPIISRPYLSTYIVCAFLSLFHSVVLGLPTLIPLATPTLVASGLAQIAMAASVVMRAERTKVLASRTYGWMALSLALSVLLEGLSMLEHLYRWVSGKEWNTAFFLAALACLLLSDSFAVVVLTNPSISRLRSTVFQAVIAVTGPLLLGIFYLEVHVLLAAEPLLGFRNTVCLVVTLLSLFCVDANQTSMNKFYRDRLSAAFLFRVSSEADVATGGSDPIVLCGDTKLSQLSTRNAPYHIVNATVNLSPEHEGLALMGEGVDSFTFTKLAVGSNSTGYRATTVMETIDPNLDLGTAIGVSGAALAPRMGTSTVDSLVMSLGIINIRLGYWCANPASMLLANAFFSRLFYGFALMSLIKEMFAVPPLKSTDTKLNIVDGGHTENLGALALLRRRAKYIISVDAEFDPTYAFGGLATVMRLARLELGATINIDLAPLRPGRSGLVERPWAIGRIVYHKTKSAMPPPPSPSSSPRRGRRAGAAPAEVDEPPGEVGYFLYIKAALCGREDVVIKEFHARNPDFPHSSTQSQAYTPAQFEAYRSLGYVAAGKQLFGPAGSRFDGTDIDGFFQALYAVGHGAAGLPAGWVERRARSGATYFVHAASNTKTWADPRDRKLGLPPSEDSDEDASAAGGDDEEPSSPE